MRYLLRLALTSLFLLGLAAPLWAQKVTSFTLKNGMQVVVIENHRAPVAVNMVWYKVGAADEKPGVSGIAHFLEHLMFKGTDTMKPGQFSATVAANGGSDNAFTSWDYTAYFQRVAADRLGLMMKMEADRMRHLKLSPEDVKTERQVILEERSQRIDNNPDALFGEQTRAAQFLNSPYGIPVIGWRQEMEKLSRKEALDFYKTYYAPNNAVLVVAGDVTPDKVKAMAEANFGVLEPTPNLPVRARPQEPPQLAARRLAMSDPRVADPYMTRSYLAPERNPGHQKTAAALTVLADLLGGNPATSVLGKALQFDKHLALYTSASYGGTSVDPTTFGFVVVPAPGVKLQDAEAALDAALAKFMKDGPDPAELARIKTEIKAAQIYGDDDTGGLARRYGSALAVGLTVQDVKDWPKILESVTAEDVMKAAREVLVAKHSVTGYLTPAGGATTGAPAAAAAAIQPGAATQVTQ
ncbi:M16 family metallopeptidase [Acidimangrovimonas pyrenivorans]|uniref:M16 family metallopeptidase n=1 Tax=Acidimangrovimonas pyrenivorans TaxID=2030798 RepID=A0ABV7ABF4_9RHOB